jgi:hypothetical protein
MENQFLRVVDMLPGLVWTAFADGQVDFLDLGCCEYTGIGLHEASADGWQSAIHLQDLIIESHHGQVWAAWSDGQRATFSFSIPGGPGGVTSPRSRGAIQISGAKNLQQAMRNL